MSKMMIMYMLTIMLFTTKFNKFLMMLISVEMLMMMTGVFILIWLIHLNYSFMIIYFLVFMVSESVLGISLLIMTSRIHNSDSSKIMNMSW